MLASAADQADLTCPGKKLKHRFPGDVACYVIILYTVW